MVIATVRRPPPARIRISSGSSVARSSRRSRTARPENSRIRTRLTGPGRLTPRPASPRASRGRHAGSGVGGVPGGHEGSFVIMARAL
nr:hypothetical protein GCM10020093_091800 [Planobispora longispora]